MTDDRADREWIAQASNGPEFKSAWESEASKAIDQQLREAFERSRAGAIERTYVGPSETHEEYALRVRLQSIKLYREVADELEDGLRAINPEAFLNPRIVSGGSFLFDGEDEVEVLWGSPDEVLWASGEALMLVGPSGVGKTTLTGQVVEALVGITSDVLGRKVHPATKVLYLAMDRPKQIRRALRRLFGPENRELLDERIVVHKGPLPVALSNDPMHLLHLAQDNQATVIIVDSMKDLARDLNDPKTGSDINAAFQHCLAESIEVIVLHHLRKSSDRKPQKPKSVDEVFGSGLILFGIGSIVLLWGQPGADVVEWEHLKPIQDKVGPWTVEHDHSTGRSTIQNEFNLLQYVRGSKTFGTTILEAARERYGSAVKSADANYRRMERQLKELVEAGYIVQESRTGPDSMGHFGERRYVAVDPVDALYSP